MIKLVGAMLAVMAGNIILGSTTAIIEKTFDWKVLFRGIFKAIIIGLGCGAMYLSAVLRPDIFVATIAGAEVNLIGGMELLFTAGIVLYGSACLIKLKDILGVKINVEAKETAQNQSEGVMAYDDAAIIGHNEAIIQDGVRPEGSI